jgi:Bacterial PH domain
MSDDFDFEPIRGLPEVPPEGESILWQGAPDWRGHAWRTFHIREVSFYFAVLVAAQPISAVLHGTPLQESARPSAWIMAAGLSAIAMLAVLAFASARSTVYTITNKRLVLRIGMALPITINLPYAVIAEAGLKMWSDDTGDMPVTLQPRERISYAVLWPHARPWRLMRPEPMFRALPEAARVADLLGRALAAHNGAAGPVRAPVPTPENDVRMPQNLVAST